MEGGQTSLLTHYDHSVLISIKSCYTLTKKLVWKPLRYQRKCTVILHTCIYKPKLLTFPNISVFSLHQPILSTKLLLGNRNLQMNRHRQTPSSSCHSCPTTILYILIKNHHSINIQFLMHCMWELKTIQFVHGSHFIWQLLLVTSHCCSTPDM
jgi:hypothetical protein